MDFVADALFDGRRLRTLTIVDNYTRECLAIEVNGSLKGEDVVSLSEPSSGSPPKATKDIALSGERTRPVT